MDQVQERVNQGMTEDQIVAAGLTDACDTQVNTPGMTNEALYSPARPGTAVENAQ